MFYLSEKNPLAPRVILVQGLLRLKGFELPFTGKWDKATGEAIGKFRTQIGMASEGPVDGQVFYNLIHDTKLKLIKSVDASAGDVAECVKYDSVKAGISPIMNPRKFGSGVADAVEAIKQRAKGHSIALLSIHGHGNGGTQISIALGNPHALSKKKKWTEYYELESHYYDYIDEKHFEKHRAVLASLRPLFAPFASVEVNSCFIATKSPNLLSKLANTFFVPVSGGKEVQTNGTWDYDRNCVYNNKFGEKVNATFELEGDVLTAYPNQLTMEKWATHVEGAFILSEFGKEMKKPMSIFAGK